MQRGKGSKMLRFFITALAVLMAAPAMAQATYPTRPIRFIVPFAPGGSNDFTARLMAPRMAARLGQPVVIETRSGAGGMTGVDVAAKAPADGYTMALGTTGAIVIGPSLTRNPPFVAERDLAPITLAINVQVPIVVPAQSPYRSLQDFLAAAKAQPGKITFGTSGTGGMPHLAGELLNQVAGVQMVHVPYRGGGPVGTALLQAEVDMGMSDMSVFLAHHRAGTMRILAVGSAQRLPYLPDVPTLAESGITGVETSNWAGDSRWRARGNTGSAQCRGCGILAGPGSGEDAERPGHRPGRQQPRRIGGTHQGGQGALG